MANIEKRVAKSGAISYRVKIRLRGYPEQIATFARITDAKKWIEIRNDIKIIICGGQHDALRLSEPQPPLDNFYAQPLYDIKNIVKEKFGATNFRLVVNGQEIQDNDPIKFAELKKLDPETEQKGFEKLSNEIMQNLVDINLGKEIKKKY